MACPAQGRPRWRCRSRTRYGGAFPDGQLWVPLEGATGHSRDPGEVLGELVRALGVPGSAIPQSTLERASLYRSRLAGRRVLVLADDAASAAQVQPLLPGTSQCGVLITSRSDLAGPAGSWLLPLEPLTHAEAVQLLTKILGQHRVNAELGAADELAAACGQLPLAVRIAGARLAGRTSWQLSALARKITDARRRLDELETGDMSVRASLTQSYETLDEPARRAFRLLALLDSAEFTEWQVAALLGISDAAAVGNRLADSSLNGSACSPPSDGAARPAAIRRRRSSPRPWPASSTSRAGSTTPREHGGRSQPRPSRPATPPRPLTPSSGSPWPPAARVGTPRPAR